MRIAFLYNHDAIHQVAHSAGVIAPLAAAMPGAEITVLATSNALIEAVRDVSRGANCTFVRLNVPAWHGPVLRVADLVMPLSRVDYLRHNAKLLGGFDAVVVTERTSLLLQKLPACQNLKIIYISHGSGDRSIGFKRDMGRFDLMLLSGEKLKQRFLALGISTPEKIKVVGYPKFDALGAPAQPRRFFENKNPVVLYNPHHEPHLSSWYGMGTAVLDYFLANPNYNLIFAPHVMMFKRRWHVSLEWASIKWRGDLAQKYFDAPNILIDTGSPACSDMTYTNAADIYLGDVSSQVYEFLRKPRPCIHINAHGAQWQGDPNYYFWTLGPVIDKITDLDGALKMAQAEHAKYKPLQEEAIRQTFGTEVTPANTRAAHAIAGYLSELR